MDEWKKLLGLALRAGKVVTGEDGILSRIRNHEAQLVIVATNASQNTKKRLHDKCQFYNIQYIEYGTIEELSHSINKLNRVAVAICDSGFSTGLLAKITK